MSTPSPRPRREVENLTPAAHGGPNYAELERWGLTPGSVIDFSVNGNPLGPSPAVAAALGAVDIGRYPDAEASALRRALAERFEVPSDCIVAGNGSAELLWLLALAYLRPGDRVVVIGPTFGEYEVAARLMGAEVSTYRAAPEDDFRPDVDAIARLVVASSPRLVFLCNPNNPTGHYLGPEAVDAIQAAARDGLLVLDEAYVNFTPEPWPSAPRALAHNLVVLRSLTKDHALAGLRLGYAIARPEVAEALRRVRPPWNVNALAQAAGLASLADEAHQERSRAVAAEAVTFLQAGLRQLGVRVLPTAANFFLAEVGDAAAFRDRLLARGLQVRDCTSFGLPQYVRLAARPLPDCRRLLAAIAEVGHPAAV